MKQGLLTNRHLMVLGAKARLAEIEKQGIPLLEQAAILAAEETSLYARFPELAPAAPVFSQLAPPATPAKRRKLGRKHKAAIGHGVRRAREAKATPKSARPKRKLSRKHKAALQAGRERYQRSHRQLKTQK